MTAFNWMFSCYQASRLASRAMEEPLGPVDRRLLGLHLLMCSGCANFSRRLEFLRQAGGKVPEVLEREDL